MTLNLEAMILTLIVAGVAEQNDKTHAPKRKNQRKPLKELDINDDGLPVLPEDYMEASLPELKDFLRAFVTGNYRMFIQYCICY
jgi:hypothetical protein